MSKKNSDVVPSGLTLIPATDTEPERVQMGGSVYSCVRCPFCDAVCDPAETVDVGFGGGSHGQQVAPHYCGACEAHEATQTTKPGADTNVDKCGWFAGPESPPL